MQRLTKILFFAILMSSFALSQQSQAAQIMVLNMKASKGASASLAQALTPILVAELSRRQGMSVIAQEDVRALLENEAHKQSLGCDDASCMTEIAGSLGTELLVSSSLAKIGKQHVINLTLFDVQKAKAFRRSSARQAGGEEAAAEAVTAAVQDLFRAGLPAELQGPASLSRRGFQASLMGFAKLILDANIDSTPARRRIILDLVNTELDYDVEPKFRALDLTSRRQMSQINDWLLVAKDSADRDRLLHARSLWVSMREDLERVKEIRSRARARGVVPSGRPLRFQQPDPLDWPPATEIRAYKKAVKAGIKQVKKALKQYKKKNKTKFLKLWSTEQQHSATRFFESQKNRDERYARGWKLVPLFALTPRQLQDCIDHNKKGELLVYLAEFRKGKVYDDDRVYLLREKGVWKIKSW